MFFKEADDLAVSVMERMGIVSVVPIIKQYYDDILNKDYTSPGGRMRDNMDYGVLDGAVRDGGGRDGPGRDGGRQNKLPLVGKVPGDLKLLKAGGERLCKEFMRGRCKNPKDKKNRGCMTKDGDFSHLCGVATHVNKNGTVRLCGGPHEPEKCPHKK